MAEIAAEYLKKGSQIYIEGKLRTRKWQDKDGNDRWTTEIIANELQMLGGRSASIGDMPEEQTNQSEATSSPSSSSEDFNDDIPF